MEHSLQLNKYLRIKQGKKTTFDEEKKSSKPEQTS